MTGMTPERLRAIEDRLPGEVFPNSVEHDALNLLDEVKRLRSDLDEAREAWGLWRESSLAGHAHATEMFDEVMRLRTGIQGGLDESRSMQAEQRSSVTLAYLQGALDDLLNPTEGEGDE